MYDHDYVMDFHLIVMLRSTTGPYGRPVIEVAYEEMIAREKWLKYWHDASSMFDIPGSTPVWAQCILFFEFRDIKTYIYCFQNLYVV